MSYQDELRHIHSLTDLDLVKTKRSSRRGLLTKNRKKFDNLVRDLSPQEISLSDLIKLATSCDESVNLHDALQNRFDELRDLVHGVSGEARKEEREVDEEQSMLYDTLLRDVNAAVTRVRLTQQGTVLQTNLETLLDMEDLTVPSMVEDITACKAKVETFITESISLTSDAHVGPLRKSIQDTLRSVSSRQVREFKSAKEKESSPSAALSSSTSSSSTPSGKPSKRSLKLNLELPKFSGDPVDWHDFHELFTTSLDQHAEDLSEPERCCLLLNAMGTDDTRRIVKHYKSGSDGYQAALQALADAYGRPSTIYPHHVRALLAPTQYSYTRESLRAMREKYETSLRNIQFLKGNTLQKFLGAVLMDQFDSTMLHEWTSRNTSPDTLPDADDLITFFHQRERQLVDKTVADRLNKPRKPQQSSFKTKTQPALKVQASKFQCPVCSSPHPLSRCPTFLKYDANRRQQVARTHRHCSNCLAYNHSLSDCTSTFTCRKCNGRHHTLLHKDSAPPTGDQAQASSSSTSDETPVFISQFQLDTQADDRAAGPRPSLLHTAIVNVTDGIRSQQARAALDPGAAISLMTERLASSLKLPRQPHGYQIGGIGGSGLSKHCVTVKLQSIHSDETLESTFCVVQKIPSTSTPHNPRAILQDPSVQGKTPLADPTLGGSLDVLIGAIDTVKCLKGAAVFTKESSVAATPTIFGWTVIAPLDHSEPHPVLETQATEDHLNTMLSQLWELERPPTSPAVTTDEEKALQHFASTHSVNADGRYTVCLPRVDEPPTLGESKGAALRRFHQNEKSLIRKGRLDQFSQVLQEYFSLDHAEIIPSGELNTKDSYYMPVQGVIKDASTTTKLRAVFDASAASSTGISLNDTLLAGPNLYPLVTDIIIRFRIHPIAFSADIGKMFREIVLNPSERDLHRFLFRDSSGQLKDCRMKRLTFGVKSSPFLATRVIQHLAETHSTSHPEAAKAILNQFYVDDFLSGAESIEEARHIQQELCQLLKMAGMNLRKWRSNSSEFRESIPSNLLEMSDLQLPSPQDSSKALGMHWDVAHDSLHVAVPQPSEGIITKRIVASISAKVYDVLGLFAPAIIPSRMLLQQLWQLKIDWDTPIPESLTQKWHAWTTELSAISSRPVPRRLTQGSSPVLFRTLHGFSDASTVAYGAVVYQRAVHQDTSVTTSIIIAKARVAPLKANTIPRLELVAAHLLSKLLTYSARVLDIPPESIFAWTDSAIVLCWLRKPPNVLRTFVSHRVDAIQRSIPAERWRHVSTKSNPADLLSRGTTATALTESDLWWNGPPWLRRTPQEWPTPRFQTPTTVPELKLPVTVVTSALPPTDLWTKFSSFSRLTRVVAWIRRFIHNTSTRKNPKLVSSRLTSEEIHESRVHLLRLAQREVHQDAFESIATSKKLPKNHPLSKWDLSLNTDGLLQVCGRVRQPTHPTSPKYLTPLSLKSPLVGLFLSSRHVELSHPGISTTMAILAENFFIPGLRNRLKQISRQCVVCQKAYARPLAQRMGLLPRSRTSPSPPFSITGIDFAGPFQIRQGYTRKPVILKAYACVFVCFSTKAVHLEATADLSTEEFLAAFRRFCARRGTPSHVHTDNGTNFLGARNEIKELQQLTLSKATQKAISHLSTRTGLHWHFIPPRTPHFGGLWEAGVKAMKTLLRKIVPPHRLTFQELATILTEAEAILNSRPLTPVYSTDPDDPLVLTAGHFLIGRPLKSPPQREASTQKLTSLRRWNLVCRLSQDLWADWSGRYIQSLQARSKWHLTSRQFRIGDVVLLKDEILKQRSWPLARITKVFPGDDNIIRAVDLICQGKHFRRSTNRLILLLEDQRPPQYVWVDGSTRARRR